MPYDILNAFEEINKRPHFTLPIVEEDKTLEGERRRVLSDPNYLEKLMAHHAREFVPEGATKKLGYDATLANVESKISSSDPRKTMTSQLLPVMRQAVVDNPNLHPADVVQSVWDKTMSTNKNEIYQGIRKSDWNLIPFTGGNVKKPADFEEWEKANPEKWSFSTPGEALGIEAVATGLGIGAALLAKKPGAMGNVAKLASKILPGSKILESGNVVGEVGKAALLAVPSWWAFEAGSNVVKNILPEDSPLKFIPEMAGGVASHKLLARGAEIGMSKLFNKITERVTAKSTIATDPSAKNILNLEAVESDIDKLNTKLKNGTMSVEEQVDVMTGLRSNVASEKRFTNEDQINAMFAEREATGKDWKELYNTTEARKANAEGLLGESKIKFPDAFKSEEDELSFAKSIINGKSAEEAVGIIRQERGLKAFEESINPVKKPVITPVDLSADDISAELSKNVYGIKAVPASATEVNISTIPLKTSVLATKKPILKEVFNFETATEQQFSREYGRLEKKWLDDPTETKLDELVDFQRKGKEKFGEGTAKEGDVLQRESDSAEISSTVSKVVNNDIVDAKELKRLNLIKDFDKFSAELDKAEEAGLVKEAGRLGEVVDNLEDEIFKLGGFKSILAGIVGAGVISAFAPDEAHAGMVTQGAKDVAKALGWKDVFKEIIDKKLYEPAYVEGSHDFGETGRSISIIPDLSYVTRKSKVWFQKILSPNVVGELIYDARAADGSKLMVNPMNEIGHRTSMAFLKTAKALNLVKDIQSTVPGGETHFKEVAERMKEFLPFYKLEMEAGIHRERAAFAEKMVKEMEGKVLKLKGVERTIYEESINPFRNSIEESKKLLNEVQGKMTNYEPQYNQAIYELAQKYPSTRIALALDGDNLIKHQWLEPLISQEEKIAVGHYRRLLDEKIAPMIEAVGEDVIKSKNFIHYAPHPDFDFNAFRNEMSEYTKSKLDIVPLAKLYSRSFGGKQMMPDIQYIMQDYAPDVFKRIEMIDFWKKGKPNGWYAHMQQTKNLGLEGPYEFLNSIRNGFAPEQRTTLNDLARHYYAFEAARLIALNPSPGFKHLMKLTANIANFGFIQSSQIIPVATRIYVKATGKSILEGLGQKVPENLEVDAYKAFTGYNNVTNMIQDLDIAYEPKGLFAKLAQQVASKGGIIINNTERYDRGASFIGSLMMAAKRGMTAEQAIYSVYDTVLKTNFLTGVQNPGWLRDPKVRAMMMFQGTPFKILEHRMLLAANAGKGYSESYRKIADQLAILRDDIKTGEANFKFEVLKDALSLENINKRKDVYGIPYNAQLIRQVFLTGSLLLGGKELLDWDLSGHLLHFPGIQKGEVMFNPALNAAIRAKGDEDEFWLSNFFKKWMSSGPVPAFITKGIRLSENDIPKIYRDSKFRYLFGIPATKED
jgi:hypothetical protein